MLAFAGGAVDALSYLGVGHVFTANMTGNTVLLTVAFARGSGSDAARSAVALGGFCLGVAAGTALVPRAPRRWPQSVRRLLVLEAGTLVVVLIAWAAVGVRQIRYELIVLAALAMGTQSATVRASDVRGVNTTYMTSTLQGAIAGAVQRTRAVLSRRVETGTRAPDRGPQTERNRGPALPAAAWLTYGLGALGGAFGAQAWQAGVVGIPLVVVAAVGLPAFLPARSRRRASRKS